MSLYLGKYRRTRCSTRQPSIPGWYLGWYGKDDVNYPVNVYWDGVMWKVHPKVTTGCAFGNVQKVKEKCLWAKA